MKFLLTYFCWLTTGCRFYCFSSSSSSQAQTSATDSAANISGRAVQARDQGFAVGQGAHYAEAGAIQGSQLSNIGNTSLNLSGNKGALTVGTSGGDLAALVGQLTQASTDQINTVLDSANQQSAALSSLAEQQAAALAANSATQIAPDQKTIYTIAGVAAVAILGFVWLRNR